jgi:hypothetical protein
MTLALSTGFVTAALNQGIGWWRESAQRRGSTTRDARYLAIRLAVVLEEFAITCADWIGDNDMFRDSAGHAGKRHGSIPELAPYPDEPVWTTLTPAFLARVLTFRNEVTLADKAIEFWADVDRECIPGETDQQCGKVGYIAWVLAKDMRKHYGLGAFDPSKTSWDVVKVLKPLHDKALKRDG